MVMCSQFNAIQYISTCFVDIEEKGEKPLGITLATTQKMCTLTNTLIANVGLVLRMWVVVICYYLSLADRQIDQRNLEGVDVVEEKSLLKEIVSNLSHCIMLEK